MIIKLFTNRGCHILDAEIFLLGFSLLILTLLSSCTKPPLGPCQVVTKFGIENMPNCSYVLDQNTIIYDHNGLLKSPRNHSAAKKEFTVLLFGNYAVSNEKFSQNDRISYLLEKELHLKLKKDVRVINAGIRTAGYRIMTSKYEELLDEYRPDLVLFLISNTRQVATDYFPPRKINEFCPIRSAIEFDKPDNISKITASLQAQIQEINQISLKKNITALHFWLIPNIRYFDFIGEYSECRFLNLLVTKKSIMFDKIQSSISKNRLSIISNQELLEPTLNLQKKKFSSRNDLIAEYNKKSAAIIAKQVSLHLSYIKK